MIKQKYLDKANVLIDGKEYAMDHNAIMEKYGYCMKMQGRMPDALAGAMGNTMYIAILDTEEDLQGFFRDLLAT